MKKKYLIAVINMSTFQHFGIVVLIYLIGKLVSWLISEGIKKYHWDGNFVTFFNDAFSIGLFYSVVWTFFLGLMGLMILTVIRWIVRDCISQYKAELKKLEVEEKGKIK